MTPRSAPLTVLAFAKTRWAMLQSSNWVRFAISPFGYLRRLFCLRLMPAGSRSRPLLVFIIPGISTKSSYCATARCNGWIRANRCSRSATRWPVEAFRRIAAPRLSFWCVAQVFKLPSAPQALLRVNP